MDEFESDDARLWRLLKEVQETVPGASPMPLDGLFKIAKIEGYVHVANYGDYNREEIQRTVALAHRWADWEGRYWPQILEAQAQHGPYELCWTLRGPDARSVPPCACMIAAAKLGRYAHAAEVFRTPLPECQNVWGCWTYWTDSGVEKANSTNRLTALATTPDPFESDDARLWRLLKEVRKTVAGASPMSLKELYRIAKIVGYVRVANYGRHNREKVDRTIAIAHKWADWDEFRRDQILEFNDEGPYKDLWALRIMDDYPPCCCDWARQEATKDRLYKSTETFRLPVPECEAQALCGCTWRYAFIEIENKPKAPLPGLGGTPYSDFAKQ